MFIISFVDPFVLALTEPTLKQIKLINKLQRIMILMHNNNNKNKKTKYPSYFQKRHSENSSSIVIVAHNKNI